MGVPFEGPYVKDCNILGSILGRVRVEVFRVVEKGFEGCIESYIEPSSLRFQGFGRFRV